MSKMAWYLAFFLLIAGSAVCGPLVNEYEEQDRAMQNPDLFEGDILGVDPNTDRNAIVGSNRLWTGGIIPYRIEPELEDQRALIEKAMSHIEERTCIRFRPVANNDRYSIRIFKGAGCFSLVGMSYREQPLSLGNGCHLHAIAVHEILHAVGFYHEHSRSDRDDYIHVHYENIDPRYVAQFTKLRPNQNQLFDSFDFNSVMLYHDTAFSRDNRLKTMSSKIPGFYIPNVYTKPGMSRSDEYRVRQLYKCD